MNEVIRVTHGIWRAPAAVDNLFGRVTAALTACPAATVVCGLTAARLHGLWLPSDVDGPIEVIVHRYEPKLEARSGSRRAELRARRQTLLADEVVQLGGVDVTSEARSWLDLAARLRLPDLIALGDSALRGGATHEELAHLITRARHRRGVVAARAALPLLNARSRSRPESHLRYALHCGGLPPPAVNQAVYSDDGEWLAEPDLSYDDVRLALEYNGADHAEVRRMRRDITREIDVIARGGWHTVTFGPAEVFGRPDQVAVVVRQLRAERRHGPAAGLPPSDWRVMG